MNRGTERISDHAIVPVAPATRARAAPDGADAPVDDRRRFLENRIELAKARLASDIRRAGSLVRDVTTSARHGFVRAVAVAGGLLVVGVAIALLGRRRRRRLKVTWR